MLTAHGLVTGGSSEEEAALRANHNLVFGQVDYNAIRAGGMNLIAFDYAQPFKDSSWTRFLTELGGGDIAIGIKVRLEQIGADGVLIDTPFETDDPWGAVGTLDRIQSVIAPKFLMPNFGDAATWMGRTNVSKALASITDWHLVEVFLDINKYTIDQWASRINAVKSAVSNNKKLVLGIYDNGEKNRTKALSMMHGWDGLVYWSYKTSYGGWSIIA